MKKAFTLVELLIVIALIAILSVAVLATINPIEQSNKARDAAMKNDAAEVLGAYERYYASQTKYPWNIGAAADATAVLSSTSVGFGVIGLAGADGPLISTSELKTSFKSKKPFIVANQAAEDVFYTYHNANTNDNYVCYFPKAKANRDAVTTGLNLKCVDIATNTVINIGDGSCVLQNPPAGTSWSYAPSASAANASCVPEGKIN